MKKIQGCILMMLILFSFAGCGKQQSSETKMTLKEMITVIIDSQTELPSLTSITAEDENFITWLSDYYLLQKGQVEDGIICYANGVEASEIAVLVLADEKDGKDIKETLSEYIHSRAGAFEGYAPQQAALADGGTVIVNGRYIALLICADTSTAKKAFLSCFDGNVKGNGGHDEKASKSNEISEAEKMESGAENDIYDPAAVLQAWESGDDSSLSKMNRCILEKARDVVSKEIDDNMSDYEKELAIHDWITGWSSFDYSVFGRSSSDGFEMGSDTPFGVLINRSAMCHGYSSAFQLFMDMLGIECITVFGTPGSNGVEHSWNMVRLDGEWYCVDVAWDDPIGASPGHTYFNVTSAYLREGSIHHWDDTSVPEAAGTEYAYGNH